MRRSTGWSASLASSVCKAVPARSSRCCQSRRSVIWPDSKRTRSSTFETSPVISVALVSMERASEIRVASSSMEPRSARALPAPAITASGVRRSCEIEASRVLRRLSFSEARLAASASSARRARSSASPVCPAKVSSRCRCSGRSTRRALAGSTANTPRRRLSSPSGRYRPAAAGSVSVPSPA